MRNNNERISTFGHRILLIGVLCLFVVSLIAGGMPEGEQSAARENPQKKPMKVTLLHADRTIQRAANKDLQSLEGNVEFLYDSIYMYCDTVYYYKSRNYFESFGDVKMNQGDTLFLYGDYLYYDGNERLVQVRENGRMENNCLA